MDNDLTINSLEDLRIKVTVSDNKGNEKILSSAAVSNIVRFTSLPQITYRDMAVLTDLMVECEKRKGSTIDQERAKSLSRTLETIRGLKARGTHDI